MTRIRQIIAFAPLFLALFNPGHAMALGGPYTWEGVVCKASAFVDIEVTLGDFKERKGNGCTLVARQRCG